MKIFQEFSKCNSMIREGQRFTDKFNIWWYGITLPFNYCNILVGGNLKKCLIRNTYLENKDGIFYCMNDIGFVKTVSETYEPELRKYFDLEGGTFIDVGANIGKYSVMVGNKGNKVVSIEPEQNNFNILEKNLKLNNLKNVIPLNLACSNKNGKVKLYLKENDCGGNSIKRTFNGDYQEVQTETLDNISKRYNLKDIKLIKIDVEGVEFEVIKGASEIISRDKPKIIFECKSNKDYKKIKKHIDFFEYSIKQLDERNYIAE